MDSSSLPAETARLWHWLEHQPTLSGLTLVGGTALALHLQHRVSEDLDFTTSLQKLPLAQIQALRTSAETAGFRWKENDDPLAADEFLIAGMELHHYQQDYIVNDRVKLTFFTADQPLAQIIGPPRNSDTSPVAPLSVLFASKAILTASRSRSRDWLDLYLLMTRHGFTHQDYLDAFIKAGIPGHWEISLNRMASGHLPAHDPGYAHLLDAPPEMAEISSYFSQLRDFIELKKAGLRLASPMDSAPD